MSILQWIHAYLTLLFFMAILIMLLFATTKLPAQGGNGKRQAASLDDFKGLPNENATYYIELLVKVPDTQQIKQKFSWHHGSGGHCFIRLVKSAGGRRICRTIGFYPQLSWQWLFTAGNIKGRVVDDSNRNYDAALGKYINREVFNQIVHYLQHHFCTRYRLISYNCTDFALDVFNMALDEPIKIPKTSFFHNIFLITMPNEVYHYIQYLHDTPKYEMQEDEDTHFVKS